MADQIFVIRETPSVVRRGESPVLPNCGDARETPLILQNSTFDSCSADEGDKRLYFRKSHSLASKGHAEDDDDDDDDDGVLEVAEASDHKKSLPRSSDLDFTVLASWKEIASQLFYISSFAILGTVLRVYMGRFFGLDCEQNESGQAVDDFLTPVSILVCVTSDGKMQRGGSVFVDLPANMLGS